MEGREGFRQWWRLSGWIRRGLGYSNRLRGWRGFFAARRRSYGIGFRGFAGLNLSEGRRDRQLDAPRRILFQMALD